MAKYTEEQKKAVLARIPEIGVAAAAKEAGIPVSTVSKWNKADKTAEAQTVYAKAVEESNAAVAAAILDADMKMGLAEEEAQAILDAAAQENAQAIAEAIEEKKEDLKDKADAAKIETKKKTRSVGKKLKDKAADVKLSAQVKVEDAKDAVVANKIENKKKKAQRTRKSQERKENVKAKVDAAKKPIQKARAAKVDMIFETNGGRQITPEAIAQKIPKGADAAYIKLEENKIYWVKGMETGSVDIWE